MAESSASSSSSKQDKKSEDSVTLSPTQTSIIYWLAGAVPIAKALTPVFTYLGDVWAKSYDTLKPETRAARLYQGVVSDISRQTMTCTFQLASYFIAGDLIKIGLQKYYEQKKAKTIKAGAEYTADQKQKDDATKQMTLQVSSLFIQVVATIISRPFGGANLNKLLKREDFPDKMPRKGLDKFVENMINKHLREPKTLRLRAGKTSIVATGIITAYLGSLMGVLYGFSQFMQNTFGEKGKTTPSREKTSLNSTPTPSNAIPLANISPMNYSPKAPGLVSAGYSDYSNKQPSFSGYKRNPLSLY